MNRPLKFRAWCPREGEMYDPFTLQEAILQNDAKWHENDDLLMQFTGLTDKDGKEIYEGDRLRDEGGDVGMVEFDAGHFIIRHENGTSDFIAGRNKFEIIGNAYEG